jgi:hypothetical protein
MSVGWFIYQYFLIVPHALLLVVLFALVRKHFYRKFPIFFGYVIEQIVESAVMVEMIEHSASRVHYAVAYSLVSIVNTAFSFGVVQEIFTYMFRNYADLAKFGQPVFRWATVVFLSLAFGAAALSGVFTTQLMPVVHLFNRTAMILECGLLVTLFLFSAQLGLHWRSRVFGIALGLGIQASVELATAALRSQTGMVYQTPLNYCVMVSYHLCVLIWIFYLSAPEKSYAPTALPEHDLESWNVELERVLKQRH